MWPYAGTVWNPYYVDFIWVVLAEQLKENHIASRMWDEYLIFIVQEDIEDIQKGVLHFIVIELLLFLK